MSYCCSSENYLMKSKRTLHETNWRWLALFFQSLMVIGGYYIDDIPQALQSKFQEPPFNLSNLQFNLLYSVYLFPNAILPFLGGMLIDNFGIRPMMLLFSMMIVLGQVFFTIGVDNLNYSLLILGRLAFAVGTENNSMAQSIITTKWFRNTYLTFAIGMNLLGCRSATMLNAFFTPRLAESSDSLQWPCIVGTIVCVVSFFCAMGAAWMDKKSDNYEVQSLESTLLDLKPKEPDNVGLKDIKTLSWVFWLFAWCAGLVYASITAFLANANDFLVKRFGFSSTDAGSMVCLIYITTLIATPTFGAIADKTGRKLHWNIFAIGVVCIAQALFTFLPDSQEPNVWIAGVPIMLFGLGYSIFSTIFRVIIPELVEERLIGTAFGIATAILNSTGSVLLVIVGIVQDKTKEHSSGYYYSELLVTCIAGCGLIIGLIINILGANYTKTLEKIPKNDKSSEVTDNEKESGPNGSQYVEEAKSAGAGVAVLN